jgi:hypothetical protein
MLQCAQCAQFVHAWRHCIYLHGVYIVLLINDSEGNRYTSSATAFLRYCVSMLSSAAHCHIPIA